MKFCKNLQRIVEISDPAYSPFFVNYRMLKKLIKELPSLVPEDGARKGQSDQGQATKRPDSPPTFEPQQQRGDNTTETKRPSHHHVAVVGDIAPGGVSDSVEQRKEELGKSPGEIAFFKLLHSEFRKATYFFEKAQQEFAIREERVREGYEIMKQPNSIMVNEKWSMMAKSIFRLYRDLLLIETYAIMTYVAFSKILKKHDKVTGHSTRNAFMTNIVGKANFTHYPSVLKMISRCESLYEEVSERLLQEGKQGLYEDERLFINMINRLNSQVLGTPDGEGATARDRKETEIDIAGKINSQQPESQAVSTLRTMLEENEARYAEAQQAAQLSEDSELERKRSAEGELPASKRAKAI
mmetsp:Transcript_12008/g.33216  ORF Transcript_12008/g.33216 Transcript_12008/m.33216 type:complete len:355 (+) Transcript_12008:95-1159(+)